MQTWEYLYILAFDDNVQSINGVGAKEKLPAFLEKYGKEGWELVGITTKGDTYWRLVFKRPIEKP